MEETTQTNEEPKGVAVNPIDHVKELIVACADFMGIILKGEPTFPDPQPRADTFSWGVTLENGRSIIGALPNPLPASDTTTRQEILITFAVALSPYGKAMAFVVMTLARFGYQGTPEDPFHLGQALLSGISLEILREVGRGQGKLRPQKVVGEFWRRLRADDIAGALKKAAFERYEADRGTKKDANAQ